MAAVKKYDLAGRQVGTVEVAQDLLDFKANPQMVKDYLVALRANQRQWSANTKGRSEVSHSGQKPHPQKGTGRARQGCLAAPQYKGGGRVFTPKPKFDQHVRVNKKERRAAMRHLIAEKILSGNLVVLQQEKLAEPKTKRVAEFLKASSLNGGRVLFIGASSEEAFEKSLRNIPRTDFMLFSHVGGYELAVSRQLVILEPAMSQILNLLAAEK